MSRDVNIENQNWMMVPISGSSEPSLDNAKRKWLMVLSGIASIEFCMGS